MRRAWTVLTPVGLLLLVLSALTLRGGETKASEAGGTGLKAAAQERGVVASRHGPFEVEVLVNGYPREALYGRGRRYVEASEGAEYELRIRNPLPVRVAVALSVDGLNTIDARRSSSWDSSKWLIEPYETIRINGWQMSSSRARRFYFTTERDSYAARLGRASDLGVITAVFYRENTPRPRPVVPPIYRGHEEAPAPRPSERRGEDSSSTRMNRAEGAKRSGRPSTVAPQPDDEHAATGIGRSVDHHVRFVNLDLERRPVAEVSIRYEYRDALYKLGVLPRPKPHEDALRRRERARGFEDPRFSPEP
ncbi:MAG TPA: hypothetical protein VFS10_22460 [Pyrinomonadaceae bacterium]|nr:hypothetical protein [Pyrinomonadaceae bacterium]